MTDHHLDACDRCGGFLPARSNTCPNCSATHGLLRALAGTTAGAALAIVLAACYGAAYEEDFFADGGADAGTCLDPALDLDGDGFCGELDCDEEDPRTHAFAVDSPGDGLDQNCDGIDGTR